jgi:hypothetical protein
VALYKMAEGRSTAARAHRLPGRVRVVVPPFRDKETLESSSKDAVILFETPSREGFHIEDVRNAADEVADHAAPRASCSSFAGWDRP